MAGLKFFLISWLAFAAGCGLLQESPETKSIAPEPAAPGASGPEDESLSSKEMGPAGDGMESIESTVVRNRIHSAHLSKIRMARTPPPRGRVSVEGRPLEYSTHGYGAETIMILGGIHGNEPAGTLLVEKLASYLDVHPFRIEGKRVIASAALNPDGLAHDTRANANGIDLNRNFATRNRKPGKRSGYEPLSEPEAVFIADLIACYRPKRILSIHQPLECVDWDGPGRALAEALSETSGLPVKKLGSLPGSLGSYSGIELGIPIITLELPGHVEERGGDGLWEDYGETLMRFIRFEDGDRAHRSIDFRVEFTNQLN